MRIRRRRRIDILVLAGVVVLAGLAAAWWRPSRSGSPGCGPGAETGRGGVAQITEVIDCDFASRQRHGIYRDVAGLDPADPVRYPALVHDASRSVTRPSSGGSGGGGFGGGVGGGGGGGGVGPGDVDCGIARDID